MSSIPSSAPAHAATAAASIAAALLDAAAASPHHRRLLLQEHLDVTPADVMAELLPEAVTPITLAGQQLHAIRRGDVTVIPYLVTDAAHGGATNGGSQGFAAKLRNAFLDGAPDGEIRVLVILDSDPVETVRTASEDASNLPSLTFTGLCQAVAAAASSSPAASLIADAAGDFATRADPTGPSLERLAAFAGRPWASTLEAAATLHELGCYLADPREAGTTLAANAAWRLKIEKALAPDRDFGRELARQREFNTALLPTLIHARTATGLDYSRFTLEDVVRASPQPQALAQFTVPIVLGGAGATHAAGTRVAAWLPGGGELRVGLNRAPAPTQSIVARWSSGEEQVCTFDADQPAALLACPAGTGWRFADLTLQLAGVPMSTVTVAVYLNPGTWFPVEVALDLDSIAGAFRVEREVRAIAVLPGGRILSPLTPLVPPSPAGTPVDAVTEYAGEAHSLPVLLLGEGGTEDRDDPGSDPGTGGKGGDDDDDGTGDGADREDADEPGAGQDSGGDGGDPAPPGGADEKVDATPVHTALRFARAGSGRPVSDFSFATHAPPPEASSDWHVGWITPANAQRAFLSSQAVEGLDGLRLERTVLDQPGTLTFTLAREGDTSAAVPHPTFERLRLTSSPQLDAFLQSRSTYFAALIDGPGSVYGTLASASTAAAAVDYCAAFAALLGSLPDDGAYQRQVDRLVLCDAIEDPTSGSILVAPTNPLTVAFYLSLAEQADSWIASSTLPPPGDIADIGCQYLVPFMSLSGTWYETAPSARAHAGGQSFLWRRLRALVRTGGRPDSNPKLIARRLQTFLQVFDVYADQRQTLSIAFHEPGDATTIIDALRAFYGQRGIHSGGSNRPYLDVHLIVPDRERPPRAIEEFLSNRAGDTNEANMLARDRVRLRIWEPSDELPFCHVAFVFRSPTVRDVRQVSMGDRASTMFAGGLATVPGRHILTGENERIFYWGTFASELASEATGRAGALLGSLTRHLHQLVGGQTDRIHPSMTVMAATTISTEFMERVYDRSAWVVHLDRMIGLEAFMPQTGRQARRYLIDYEDAPDRGAGYDAITATERVEPYFDALRRALAADLSPTDQGLRAVLDAINAISGRWALRLLRDSPNLIRERVGTITALAAMRDLDRTFDAPGNLTAVLALHPDVLSTPELRASAPRLDRPACDDLVVVNIPLTGPVNVRARLVEVKFLTAGAADEGKARLQLDQTRRWLTDTFDPNSPAAPFRGRDLANLVRSATARSRVFGLGATADPASVERALGHIAAGRYTFECEYWVDDERLQGDVIAVRLDSSVATARSSLAGDGVPYGLVQLGRPAFEQVAAGEHLRAESRWHPVSFDPPAPEDATVAGPQAGRAPEGGAAGAAAPPPPPPSPGADAEAEVSGLARALDQAARKYALDLDPIQPELAQVGPSVIRFRTRPLGRQTLKGVQNAALDIGREIGAAAGVIVAQEPYYVTIDVPRRQPQIVRFADHLALLDAESEPGALPFLLGMAPSGDVIIEDLARLPHLLIAGATGSGKSVLLRGIVASLVHRRPPSELQLLVIDPKQVDFLIFEDLPHLYGGAVVTDPLAAVGALAETIDNEIERRRPLLKRAGVTSALEFYEQGGSRTELPQLVVIIDEFADLAGTLSRAERQDFLGLVQRYGQLTRAFGIYLVLATQRPSVQVITGEIKANLTARVALRVQSFQDSMTILGQVGAERLAEKGDMLFSHGSRLERLQGFLVTADDASIATRRWNEPA